MRGSLLLLALLVASPVAADEPPAAEKPTNTLRWTTASELDNFGFDVYRALAKDGPFERITKKPIAGHGTIDTPSRYTWVDENIDPAVDYWYYVESITLQGYRERFTPVLFAPAKERARAGGR
jgi:hypothetical protein